ncbi:diacylglycerol kinase family protein [Actinomycetaceae bacterium MB13-C1-2]|nr:diacylglycerol kinase family protein [Actinomycetaceae bacterium MB13-C1-2]
MEKWSQDSSSESPRSMSLVVSSMSARGRSLKLGRELVEILRDGGWQVDVHVTNSTSDVEYEASLSDHPFIGALGGDGYLTAAARGCIGHPSPLLPFPGGRGNDLCRSLGIGADSFEWARKVAAASTEEINSWIRPLDAMQVKSGDGTYVVLGVVSLGVDATANQIANNSWFRSGPLAYAWGAALAALGKYSPLEISGTIEGEIPKEYPGRDTDTAIAHAEAQGTGVFRPVLGGWVTSVANTGWIGGGVNLTPQSRTDDGLLEIITLEGIPRFRAIGKLAKVLSSRALDDPVVHIYEGTQVHLEKPAGLEVMADGDVIGRLPMDVKVLPSALRVVAPPRATEETK